MSIDTSSLNAADMESAEKAIMTLFEGSGLEIQDGSAVRELIIRPAAAIHAWQQTKFSDLVDSLDLGPVARGEVEGDDSMVDLLASTYRVTRRTGASSSGSIALYLQIPVTTYINAGFTFFAGPNVLTVGRIYVGVTDPENYQTTEEVVYTGIQQVDGAYYMVIPVSDSSGGSFSTGTPVTFTGSLKNVTRVTVLSPISGGGGRESNKSLASRVIQGLPPGVLSTATQIRGAFMDKFGVHPSRVRVFGSGETAVRRAKDMFTSLPSPGYTDVVVAPVGGPSIDVITATATWVSGNKYRLTFSGTEMAGVYSVDQITGATGTIATGSIEVTWGNSATRHRLVSGRYTAYQTAVIEFESNAGTPTLSCSIQVKRARSIDLMQRYLDDEVRRAPGQDTLVRAAVPCMISLGLAVTSSGATEGAIKAAVAEGVNALPCGSGSLSAQDIIAALPRGVTLRFPLVIKGSFILPSGTQTRSSTQGVLVAPDWPNSSGGITSEETAFFTSVDNISVSLG